MLWQTALLVVVVLFIFAAVGTAAFASDFALGRAVEAVREDNEGNENAEDFTGCSTLGEVCFALAIYTRICAFWLAPPDTAFALMSHCVGDGVGAGCRCPSVLFVRPFDRGSLADLGGGGGLLSVAIFFAVWFSPPHPIHALRRLDFFLRFTMYLSQTLIFLRSSLLVLFVFCCAFLYQCSITLFQYALRGDLGTYLYVMTDHEEPWVSK